MLFLIKIVLYSLVLLASFIYLDDCIKRFQGRKLIAEKVKAQLPKLREGEALELPTSETTLAIIVPMELVLKLAELVERSKALANEFEEGQLLEMNLIELTKEIEEVIADLMRDPIIEFVANLRDRVLVFTLRVLRGGE